MIAITRARDESVVVGDNIVITVVDIRGDKVRLGINAPVYMPVHRGDTFVGSFYEYRTPVVPRDDNEQKPRP